MELLARVKSNWKWAVAVVGTLIPLALPLSTTYRLFLCVTLWAILMWAFDLLQYAVVAIVLPVLYIVFGISDADTAFSGWLSTSGWITLGGLLFGTAFMRSGLARRLAFKMISLTSGDFKGVVLALTVSCLIITPVIPSVMGKIVLMVPIAIEICNALGKKKGSNTAAALIMVVFFALWSPKMAFPTASTDAILATSILVDQYQYDITWLGWAIDMFIPAILWTFVSVGLVFLLKPSKAKLDKQESIARYRGLGPMSGQEKKLTVMMLLVVALLATEGIHGVNPAYVLIIAAAICFVPHVGVLDSSDFKRTDLSVVFFLAGAVSIGAVASELGITADIVSSIQPILEGHSNFALVMMLYVFSIVSNFLLNPMALIATLLGPVTELCTQLGYSPVLGGYSMIMGFNQALLPYEIAPFMLIYSYGYLKMGPTMKVMAARIAVGIVFTMLITYPYWYIIGLV